MSINYVEEDFSKATEEEEAEIYEQAETVQVRKKNGTDKKLHVYECDYLKDMDIDLLTKDIAVYPPGFLDFCAVCVYHYRNGREI